MKSKFLFESKVNDKRIAVTTDTHNWIIMYGSAKCSDRNFQKKADHWYYSNIESMLVCVHKNLLRLNLKSLEIDDLLKALEGSYAFVEKMALDISEKIGVQDGCR